MNRKVIVWCRIKAAPPKSRPPKRVFTWCVILLTKRGPSGPVCWWHPISRALVMIEMAVLSFLLQH